MIGGKSEGFHVRSFVRCSVRCVVLQVELQSQSCEPHGANILYTRGIGQSVYGGGEKGVGSRNLVLGQS